MIREKYKKTLARRAVRRKSWIQVVRVKKAQQCWVARVRRLRVLLYTVRVQSTSESATVPVFLWQAWANAPLYPTCSSYTGLSFWLCSSWFLPLILKRAENNFKEPWKTVGSSSPFELLPSMFMKENQRYLL